MAVSSTSFSDRMKRINSGKTTSWTVPGQGMATLRDERKFLKNAPVKMRQKSTSKRRNPLLYVAAVIAGAGSVIAARWIDYTYFDTAMAFAAQKGVNIAGALSSVPVALSLAVVISLFAMFVLGARSRRTVPLQLIGFVGAVMFESELVKLAPELYARFYPESWILDMMANATLLT